MADDRWLYALALSAIASGVAGLLVPLYLVRVGAGPAALGASAAASSLAGAPGSVLVGRYADRTGRRRGVILLALVVSALALASFPLLTSVAGIIAVNAALAFALAAISPVLTMLVVADAPETTWNTRIARLNTFQGYGSTLGLVLGTAWTAAVALVASPALAQRTLFLAAAGVGLASAVLAARSLPPEDHLSLGPRRSDRVTTILARSGRVTRDATFALAFNRLYWATRTLTASRVRATLSRFPRELALYFGAAGVFFGGFAVFWAPLPIYLTHAGFASGAVFGLYLVNNVASAVLYGGAGELTGRHDLSLVQGGALGVRGTAFAGVAALALLAPGGGTISFVLVGVVLLVVGATWAFIAVAGTTIVSRAAPSTQRGGLLGAYAALAAVTGSVGSLLGGWLASQSYLLAFVVAGVLVVASAVVILRLRYARRTRVPDYART